MTSPQDREEAAASSEAATEHAQLAFWLFPRFVRWATIRTLQHQLGGDLSLRQLTVLYLIRSAADTTPGELARQLQVTPAVMTGLVDRLERNGYLRRVDDLFDRRRVQLALTEEGRRVSVAVEQALVAEMASHLANLNDAELAELGRGLARLALLVKCLEVDAQAED